MNKSQSKGFLTDKENLLRPSTAPKFNLGSLELPSI